MMRQGSKPLPRVTGDMLDRASERNLGIVESLRGVGSTKLKETVRKMVTGYGQPEVLRYVLEALMEPSEEESSVRDQMKGMIMIHLKTLIDCLDT